MFTEILDQLGLGYADAWQNDQRGSGYLFLLALLAAENDETSPLPPQLPVNLISSRLQEAVIL